MTSQHNKQNGSINFELLAPRVEFATLLGDWNHWKPIPMERGQDGVWRVEVKLADGDYTYQFQIKSKSKGTEGKVLNLPDPTAVEFGKRSDSDDCTTLRVRNGKRSITAYQWQHDEVPLPANEQLIIYEMHIGDFRGGRGDNHRGEGNFQGVIEKLDYLSTLGVNAIQLMPVNETASSNYWGYSQRSIYAVENTYGSPDDFCRLVDECHARGMRVIHDAVFNHVDDKAPMALIDHDYWFYEKKPDEPNLQFGPKFNYEYYDEQIGLWPAREHVINAIKLWINEFHIDGIRFDSTRAIKHYDLLQWFNEEAHQRTGFKPFYTIAEHLPQDPSITGTNGPIDAAWHDNFYRQLITTVLGVADENHQPFINDEVLRVIDARRDGFDSAHNTINYLNNHDQERVMYLLGEKANTFDDAAFSRSKLGAALLLLSPGIPMLWMGEEFGQATPKSEKRQPLDWSLLNNQRNNSLWEHYCYLIHLRQNNPALYSDHFEVLANMTERGIIAFKRWDAYGNIAVIVVNLTSEYAGKFEIPLPDIEDGRWREAMYNYEVVVERNCLSDTLAASEVKVYVRY